MALDDPDLPMKGLVPPPEDRGEMMTLTIRHERPEYEYSFMLPDGWYQQPDPPGRPDVAYESEFIPLGVFTPTPDYMPPVVFSVAVRPAPKTGTVAEWLEWQCQTQGLALQRMTIHDFLFGPGVDAVALEESEVGPLKMRLTMFEDGGRLFLLIGMAPLSMWDTVVATLGLAIVSFELLAPEGRTAALLPVPPEAQS